MSTHAARKMRTVLRNVEHVLAIELIVAAQALDWRVGMPVSPIGPRREMSLAEADEQARRFESIDARKVAAGVAPALRNIYTGIRKVSPAVTRDRALSDDVHRVHQAFFNAETRTRL
jgi:histidine ammonia-lyase